MTDNEPTFRIVQLTPEMASELLSRNPRNRKISRANYGTVKRAIMNGEWMLNGEGIKVSENGYILDGQHRCMAVVETGVTIPTLLIEGLPDSTQDTMDTGKVRSLADVLYIRGEANNTALAALIRRFVIEKNWGFEASFSVGAGGRSLTNHECLDWFDANQWARDYVSPGKSLGNKLGLGGANTGFLMNAFDRIDREDSEYFWARLGDGLITEPAGNPIWVLRETLTRMNEDLRGTRNQKYLAAIVLKAWNAYRNGDQIGLLRFRLGGSKPEPFPEPR